MPMPLRAPHEDALYRDSTEADLARRMFEQAATQPTPEQLADIQRRAELSDEGLSSSQFGDLQPLH